MELEYKNARTGDILLFSSWSIPSLLTRVGTYSEWTHTAIAVWLNTDQGKRLYMFEAARIDDEHCALVNGIGNGCRLVNIDQVKHLYSKIAVRQLDVSRDEAFYTKLKAFMRKYQGVGFPSNYFRVFLINTGLAKRKQDDDGKILCSELCSKWLEECGSISKSEIVTKPHHLATPACFSKEERFSNFDRPIHVMTDDGTDNAVRIAIGAVWVCSLFFYILLSVEDEQRYLTGYRRKDKR
jgi:hypothetical protein